MATLLGSVNRTSQFAQLLSAWELYEPCCPCMSTRAFRDQSWNTNRTSRLPSFSVPTRYRTHMQDCSTKVSWGFHRSRGKENCSFIFNELRDPACCASESHPLSLLANPWYWIWSVVPEVVIEPFLRIVCYFQVHGRLLLFPRANSLLCETSHLCQAFLLTADSHSNSVRDHSLYLISYKNASPEAASERTFVGEHICKPAPAVAASKTNVTNHQRAIGYRGKPS